MLVQNVGRNFPYVVGVNGAFSGSLKAGDPVRVAINGQLREIIGVPTRLRNTTAAGGSSTTPPVLPQLLWGLWSIPEGQPRISHSPISNSAAFSSARAKQNLHALGRVDSGTFTYADAREKMDCLGLLVRQDTSGPLLLAFYLYYQDNASQPIKLKIKEIQTNGSVSNTITLDIHARWEGTVGPNGRNFGYMFYREGVSEWIYTLQIGGSLVSFNKSSPLSFVVSQLSTLSHTPSVIADGSCNIAGIYAADCRYTAYDADSTPPGNQATRSMVHFYKQGADLKWTPLPPIDCRVFTPTGAGTLKRISPVGLTSYVGVPFDSAFEHHAKWIGDGTTTVWTLPTGTDLDPTIVSARVYDPSGAWTSTGASLSGHEVTTSTIPNGHMLDVIYTLNDTQILQELPWVVNMQSSRWPLLSTADKREWWWHMICEMETATHRPKYLQILATDAETGDTGLVFREGPEDWDGTLEVSPGIVATQYAAIQAAAAASVASGAPETLLFNGTQMVSTTCTPAGVSAVGAPLTEWLRGFTLIAPLSNPDNVPKGYPINTLPQPDRLQYDNGPNWSSLITTEGYGFPELSWSRQLATGAVDESNNHYLIYTKTVPYATGAYYSTEFLRTVIEEADPIFTYFQYPPEGEEFGGNGWGYVGDSPVVNPGWSVKCINSPYGPTKRWYAQNARPYRSFENFWKTYLVSHSLSRTQRYKLDISLKYNLPNGWQQIPCHAPVWAHPVIGNTIAILRDDFWNKTGSTLVGYDTEPVLEVRNATTGALMGKVSLHPASDATHRYVPHATHPPSIRLNKVEGGPNQAIVCCRWSDGLDMGNSSADGHSLHVIDLDTFTSTELWGTGLKPSNFPSSQELNNSVLHGGVIYWIDGAIQLSAI
jgi:hypothetical protein